MGRCALVCANIEDRQDHALPHFQVRGQSSHRFPQTIQYSILSSSAMIRSCRGSCMISHTFSSYIWSVACFLNDHFHVCTAGGSMSTAKVVKFYLARRLYPYFLFYKCWANTSSHSHTHWGLHCHQQASRTLKKNTF